VTAPEEFGPYLVYEQLGSGGMATVHRAVTRGIEGFQKQVALKRMLPNVAADASLVRSFIREAQLASNLRHANVAQTYDLGKVGKIYFIAMELVRGRNLREILKHCAAVAGFMPLSIALNISCQICDALDYAHNLTNDAGQLLGIIHRDVSPSNIIVGEGGVVKLIDFGIAKATASESMNTMSGTIKGKFSYMAPEYLMGANIDPRADLFALGVIMHELLSNRPLFQGKDDMDTLYRVKDMPIPPPSAVNPSVPPELDSIVLTALARDPDQRWQRANALRQALATEMRRLDLVAHNAQVLEWVDSAFARTRKPARDYDADSSPVISISPATTELPASAAPVPSLAQKLAASTKPPRVSTRAADDDDGDDGDDDELDGLDHQETFLKPSKPPSGVESTLRAPGNVEPADWSVGADSTTPHSSAYEDKPAPTHRSGARGVVAGAHPADLVATRPDRGARGDAPSSASQPLARITPVPRNTPNPTSRETPQGMRKASNPTSRETPQGIRESVIPARTTPVSSPAPMPRNTPSSTSRSLGAPPVDAPRRADSRPSAQVLPGGGPRRADGLDVDSTLHADDESLQEVADARRALAAASDPLDFATVVSAAGDDDLAGVTDVPAMSTEDARRTAPGVPPPASPRGSAPRIDAAAERLARLERATDPVIPAAAEERTTEPSIPAQQGRTTEPSVPAQQGRATEPSVPAQQPWTTAADTPHAKARASAPVAGGPASDSMDAVEAATVLIPSLSDVPSPSAPSTPAAGTAAPKLMRTLPGPHGKPATTPSSPAIPLPPPATPSSPVAMPLRAPPPSMAPQPSPVGGVAPKSPALVATGARTAPHMSKRAVQDAANVPAGRAIVVVSKEQKYPTASRSGRSPLLIALLVVFAAAAAALVVYFALPYLT